MNILTEKIYSLFFRIGYPTLVGKFFATMYNIVDTYFAGLLGDESLTGMTISFPIYLLLFSIGAGLSSSAKSLMANSLGEHNEKKANIYLSQTIVLGIIFFFIIGGGIYFSLSDIYIYFNLHGEAKSEGMAYVETYILSGGALFLILSNILDSAFTSRGITKIFRNIYIFGFFLNLLLNPLLAFGYSYGSTVIIPALGVKGIALSTAILQYLSFLTFLILAFRNNFLNKLSIDLFKLTKDKVKDIITLAIPAFISMISVSLSMFIHNKFVSYFGQEAIAGYGGALRIEQIALMPIFAVGSALMVMVGQNNGAKNYERVKEIYKKGLIICFCTWIVFYSIILYFAPFLLSLFTKTKEIIDIGAHYIRIQALTYLAYVVISLSNSFLIGIKKSKLIIYNEIYRHVVGSFLFIYPFVFLLDMGIDGVWYGIVAKGWTAAMFINFSIVFYYYKKFSSKK